MAEREPPRPIKPREDRDVLAMDFLSQEEVIFEEAKLNPASHDYDKPEVRMPEINKLKGKIAPLSQEYKPEKHAISNLKTYIEEYGIPINKLTPYQIHLLRLAKELERLVKELKLDMSSSEIPSDEKIMVEEVTEKVIQFKDFQSREISSDIPTDLIDYTQMDRFEQLVNITPIERLMEEECPDLFYKKLACKELMRQEWRENKDFPIDSYKTIPEIQLVEKQAPPTTLRYHAESLLDISVSMNDKDKRGDFAKGLTLAFLHEAHKNQGFLHFRPFAGEALYESSARNKEQFTAMTKRILELSAGSGGTEIGEAVKKGCADIKKDQHRHNADMLLITDGIPSTSLGKSPLGNTKLHTFIIGDITKIKQDDYKNQLDVLKSWSSSYEEVNVTDYSELFRAPYLIQDAAKKIERTMEKLEKAVTEDEIKNFMEEIESLYKIKNALMQNFSVPGTGPPIRTNNKSINRAIEKIEEQRAEEAAAKRRPNFLQDQYRDAQSSLNDLATFSQIIEDAIQDAKLGAKKAARKGKDQANLPAPNLDETNLLSLLNPEAGTSRQEPGETAKAGWLQRLLKALGMR